MNRTLVAFAKSNCACWSKSDKLCTGVDFENRGFNEGPCLLEKDRPCRYFEQAILKTIDPNYKFADQTHLYDKIMPLYLKINPNVLQTDDFNVRKCQCGQILKKRHRYCDKCTTKREKDARRNWRRKHRG